MGSSNTSQQERGILLIWMAFTQAEHGHSNSNSKLALGLQKTMGVFSCSESELQFKMVTTLQGSKCITKKGLMWSYIPSVQRRQATPFMAHESLLENNYLERVSHPPRYILHETHHHHHLLRKRRRRRSGPSCHRNKVPLWSIQVWSNFYKQLLAEQ